MRPDYENTFTFDTALGTAQDTVTYGAVIDAVKPGNSHPELYLVASVREAVTSAGAATVRFLVQMADDSNFNANAETVVDTGALALSALTAGSVLIKQRLPLALRRYMRVRTTVATANLTAGKVDIALVDGVDFAGM